MRLMQDDIPSISISPLRAQGVVTEGMGSVRVAIAGVEREVRLSHRRFSNGGGWSFFRCPECGRRARVLKLNEKIACWCCTRAGSPARRLPYRVEHGDRAGRIDRLVGLLYSGQAARLKPRLGRKIDRRDRLERSLRRALIAERSGLTGFDPDA
jgi:hypothetical protein